MVDFFTVPPVFVSVYLNRSWLGKFACISQLSLSLCFINPFFLSFSFFLLLYSLVSPCFLLHFFAYFFLNPTIQTLFFFHFSFCPQSSRVTPPFYHSLALPQPLSPPSVSPLLGVCLGGPLARGCSQLFLIIESDRAGLL